MSRTFPRRLQHCSYEPGANPVLLDGSGSGCEDDGSLLGTVVVGVVGGAVVLVLVGVGMTLKVVDALGLGAVVPRLCGDGPVVLGGTETIGFGSVRLLWSPGPEVAGALLRL